jgi:RimJ/RimL family protein N-acetyltransferase
MHVRRLDTAEWPTARAVRLRALRESPNTFSSSYEEEVDHLGDWWVQGMTRLAWFVAEEDDEIVGVVAGMPLGDRPEVISMWVDPEHRGRGVANDLLAAVVAWAKEGGAAGLCLAVAGSNHVARRFYERTGFVPSGPGEALRSRPEVCTTEMRLNFRGD